MFCELNILQCVKYVTSPQRKLEIKVVKVLVWLVRCDSVYFRSGYCKHGYHYHYLESIMNKKLLLVQFLAAASIL